MVFTVSLDFSKYAPIDPVVSQQKTTSINPKSAVNDLFDY